MKHHLIKRTYHSLLERMLPSRPEDLKASVSIDQALAIKLYRVSIFTLSLLFLFLSLQFLILGSYKMALLQLGVSVLFLVSWGIYYKTGEVSRAGNFILFFGGVSAFFRAHYMGGIHSPVFFVWPLIPVFGSLLLPMRQALLWTCAYLCVALGFDAVDRFFGIRWESQVSPQGMANVRLFSIVAVQVILFGAMYFLKEINRKFRDQSASEKESKTSLLRVLSHDMASPLTTLHYTMERIQEEGGKVEKADLARMERAIGAATAILAHVRELEAIGSGKLKLIDERVNLYTVMHDVVFLQEENAKKKGVHLKIVNELPQDVALQPWVVSDRRALTYQVLANLVSNAIKFTHPGGTVELGWTMAESQWIDFWVKDAGVGIPQELLEVIFDPVHHTTRPGTAGEKGTGFGMPLVKSYIDAMGGEIEVTSSTQDSSDVKAVGTCVEIALLNAQSEEGRERLNELSGSVSA